MARPISSVVNIGIRERPSEPITGPCPNWLWRTLSVDEPKGLQGKSQGKPKSLRRGRTEPLESCFYSQGGAASMIRNIPTHSAPTEFGSETRGTPISGLAGWKMPFGRMAFPGSCAIRSRTGGCANILILGRCGQYGPDIPTHSAPTDWVETLGTPISGLAGWKDAIRENGVPRSCAIRLTNQRLREYP